MKDAASPSFGNIDRLLEEIGNKYLLVNGIEPLVEGANPEKAVTTAFSEIRTGKLDIEMDTTIQGNGRRG